MHLPIPTNGTYTLNFTIPEILTFSVVVVDQLGNPVSGAQIFPYNKDYSGWYITGPAIKVPIIQEDASNVGPDEQGQIYVGTEGPQNIITADASGHAQYSFFLTSGVSIRMGCRDPLNSPWAGLDLFGLYYHPHHQSIALGNRIQQKLRMDSDNQLATSVANWRAGFLLGIIRLLSLR